MRRISRCRLVDLVLESVHTGEMYWDQQLLVPWGRNAEHKMNSAKCLSACFSIRRIWHRSGRTRFRTPPRGSQHSSRVFESGNPGRSVAVYRMSTGNTWEVQILSGSIYANVNLRNCEKMLTCFLWCFHPAWCRSSHYTHSTWNRKERCLHKQKC
jgi:hypothetical protein